MSAFRNKKSNSGGLRVLWIPGRKRHNHKGNYGSTSKHINYSNSNNRQQGKNENWSIGGTRGHHELVESHISESAASSSKVSDILLPAACVSVPEVNLQKDDVNNMKFESESDINSVEKDIKNCSSKDIRNNESDLNGTDVDVPDISLPLQSQNVPKLSKIKKNKKKNKNKNEQNLNHHDEEIKDDKDEATVKCLYYTLMCCECTIS